MEGRCLPEPPPPSLPPSAENTGCNHELTRWNSDASALTAGNRKDILCPSANGMLDDCTAWTDEKHNLYLHHLEGSFTKQLHQSKCLLAQCSEKNQRDLSISQKQLINVSNSFEQFNVSWNGCWKKINCARGEPLSSSISVVSSTPLEWKERYNFSHMGMHSSLPSANMPEFVKLFDTEKHQKRMIYCGLTTSSEEFSPNKPSHGDLFDLTLEGMGQNFLDESNQRKSDESQAKSLKAAVAESSVQNQIVPSKNCAAHLIPQQ